MIHAVRGAYAEFNRGRVVIIQPEGADRDRYTLLGIFRDNPQYDFLDIPARDISRRIPDECSDIVVGSNTGYIPNYRSAVPGL